MRRFGHISPQVETLDNFRRAFYDYARQKMHRQSVQQFEANLDHNLDRMLGAYQSESWHTSPYVAKDIDYPKHRQVNKLPVIDHVMQHAALAPVEADLRRTIHGHSPAGTKGKGTHYFYQLVKRDIFSSPQAETFYCLPMDIHHYFQSIDHNLLKAEYRRKIKDRKLLAFIDEVVDSFNPGIVLGVKLAQLLGQLFLARFDYLAIRCFDILQDADRFRYWQARYVSDMLVTCRTPEQARLLSGGVKFLNDRFERFCQQGLSHYYRFMDNIYILHEDKVFLRLMAELSVMHLARDWHLSINKSWGVHRTCDGIDFCDQIIYADHALLRKRFKHDLCAQVAKLRKQGYSERQIQLKAASRLGLGIHANTKNLYKKIGMERFGKLVKARRARVPFEGMEKSQQQSIEDIICSEGQDENKFLIQVIDYKVDDSVIEKETVQVEETAADGSTHLVTKEVPKKRLTLRYRIIDHIEGTTEVWQTTDHYLYTGSKILIDQALNDFCRDELPFSTVVKELHNKFKKKFYKFT